MEERDLCKKCYNYNCNCRKCMGIKNPERLMDCSWNMDDKECIAFTDMSGYCKGLNLKGRRNYQYYHMFE